MRIVFFGTPELAVPALAAVADKHDLVALVCQPDRPKGRGKKLEAPPTKVWALKHGIPVHQPVKLNDGAFEEWLNTQQPDVCCLAAYGRILKQPILEVPIHGFLNVHPSMLPKYRGASPIQTALLNGDRETGVSIMRLDAGVDTGDVIVQEAVSINPEDTAGTLTARLADVGARLLVEALEQLENGRIVYTPQDDAQATHTQFFTKGDGRIDWSLSAIRIHNLVRATTPWPGAQCIYKAQVCRISRTRVGDSVAGGAPGTVVGIESDHIRVATGEGQLLVFEFQAPGKRSMPMAEFLRGCPMKPGERFENFTS